MCIRILFSYLYSSDNAIFVVSTGLYSKHMNKTATDVHLERVKFTDLGYPQ